MKRNNYLFAILFVASLTFTACGDDESENGNNVNEEPEEVKLSITDFDPKTGLADQENEIKVTGTGFGATPEDNTVVFPGTQGSELEATVESVNSERTEMVILTPAQTIGGYFTVTVGDTTVTSNDQFIPLL